MKSLIIEARINEYTGRNANPHVPWSEDEIVDNVLACREAGAASVHFHVRGPNGEISHDYEKYRKVMEKVRKSSDVLLHPTLGASEADATTPESRMAHVRKLVGAGLAPDIAPLDFATGNVDYVDPTTGRYLTTEGVYINTTATLQYLAKNLRDLGVAPNAVIWSIPSLRQASLFMRTGDLKAPVYMLLSLSSDILPSLHPATVAGLEAYLPFIPTEGVEWSAFAYGASMLPLLDTIIRRGGHISTGLGDYHYSELGKPTNADVVRELAKRVRDAGRPVASPDDARRLLGLQPTSQLRQKAAG